jgi:hypothetical protein
VPRQFDAAWPAFTLAMLRKSIARSGIKRPSVA